MPDFVTLYTYNPPPSPFPILRTVIRSTTDPTYISYTDYGGTGSAPQPPADTIVSRVCQPGTFDQYTYRAKTSPPYAYYEKVSNSPECGYTPPVCDLSKVSFTKSDETEAGANDGAANLFCTTSYPVITYYLATNPSVGPQVIIQTNTTGYFIGIAPGPYVIIAEDANSCQLREFFTILAFSDDLTHYKYRLLFKDATGLSQWELQLYDMKHNYLKTDYPKDVVGNEDPVIMSIGDPNEDKFTSIISRQLDITLEYTGLDFTPDEFSLAPENTWYVQLLKDGDIEFKGYILPDEIQNFYADSPYLISLKATDGLPSLKGNLWGNGTGGQGYGTYQIQQYGLTRWCLLLKQCLDQLGYDYGYTHVVSSLRFNNAFTSSLWGVIGTWSDILYDSSGVPLNTYDALNLLLSGMKLTMFQHKGEFYLVNWNDLWYINNGVVATEYGFCFYEFPPDFNTSLTIDGPRPEYTVLGYDQPFKPVNPPQNINYDKAYNIESDVSFNILALLYENPSFEIGAVQGELPPGWVKHSGANIVAYCQYNPVTEDVGSGALDGNWELRIEGADGTRDNYIEYGPFDIDQANKLINISLAWKSADSTVFEFDGHPLGFVFSMGIIFQDGGSSNAYYLQASPNPALSFADYTDSISGDLPPQPAQPTWSLYSTSYSSESTGGVGPSGLKPIPTTDFVGWQNYSITSPVFPESQRGQVWVRFYATKNQLYDRQYWPQVPHHFNDGMYIDMGGSLPQYYVAIDQLNITISDATESQYNLQTGEKHITTVVTGLPNADLKQQDLSLFTYPNNKRVAGNIFYGSDYLTSTVANTWSFALRGLTQDRLPAIITQAYSRQYARCMNKFEGDILTPYLSFYSVFGLRFIDGVLFVAFSIEGHLRTNVWHTVLIEISDADAQVVYQYTPIYERSARNN